VTIMPVELALDEFIDFPVDGITDNSTTDFELFLKVSDHCVLYGGSGYKWYRRELTDLLRHGIDQFLIRPEDCGRAEMYRQLAQLPLLEKNLAPKERIVRIEQIGAEFTRCLYNGEITDACVAKANDLAESMVDCIAEDPSCIQELTGLADHDYYTYVHSIRVGAYTAAVAIEMGLTDHRRLQEIALGGIMHDIGKKEVPIEVINKVGALTDIEWDQMRSHPSEGAKLLDHSLLSMVPKEIILHHHEKLDGSGYPDGLQESGLLVEVQIATLADVFDALTSSRSYQQKRSRFEALDFMRHKMVGDKLAKEPFRALVACLVSE